MNSNTNLVAIHDTASALKTLTKRMVRHGIPVYDNAPECLETDLAELDKLVDALVLFRAQVHQGFRRP